MDIKLFSLCKQEDPRIEEGKKHILSCVKSFFPHSEGFMTFTSQKRMLLAAAQSLRGADIVIVAVQNNMYNATKRLLAQALDFKMMKNNTVFDVLNPLYEEGKIKQATLAGNAFFPQGALLLPTEDMLNCGFVLSAGSQCIIYLPVEAPYASEVVFGSLYDFFSSICDDSFAPKALYSRHKEIAKRTADKFDSQNIKVAFSPSRATALIEALCNGLPSAHCFSFHSNIEYNESADNTLIDEARKAKDIQYASFGIAFSEITLNNNGERILKVAIADNEGTNTYTHFAAEDESDDDFTVNCVDKTMLMLYNFEKLACGKSSPEVATKEDKNLRKFLLCLSAGAVGASAVIGFILAMII